MSVLLQNIVRRSWQNMNALAFFITGIKIRIMLIGMYGVILPALPTSATTDNFSFKIFIWWNVVYERSNRVGPRFLSKSNDHWTTWRLFERIRRGKTSSPIWIWFATWCCCLQVIPTIFCQPPRKTLYFRFSKFKRCVDMRIGDCHKTWELWQQWNVNLEVERQFRKEAQY